MSYRSRRPWVVFVLLWVAVTVGFAQSEPVDEFESRITEELRLVNPEAADLFVEANAARDEEDRSRAERLYREVLDLDPGFIHAKRRLSFVVLLLGRRTEALALTGDVMARAETPENRAARISALIFDDGDSAPTPQDIAEAEDHAWILVAIPEVEPEILAPVCQAAMSAQNAELLEKSVERLYDVGPDEVYTHYCAWVLGVSLGQYDRARNALDRARELGLDEETYARFLTITEDSRSVVPRLARIGAVVGGIWLATLVLLLLAGTILSRLTLRASRERVTTANDQSAGFSASLRKIYRTVLWMSCAYYYISVPLVLLVVLLAGGGLIYSFFVIGRIPIKLVVIIGGVVLITLWAAVKSFFVRGRDEDPGERLNLEANPRLRGTLREVAAEIGTRPVDNVYMTPGTELAVMERGGILRQLRGATERCLILGVGVLDGMSLGPFKAILAHEYGHFSNRDTAGGGFALSVRRSMAVMAQHLADGGAATWYNPAWLFLNGFNRIFLRVSQGASRLQEVLADRWAAFAYGARSFEKGLRHVIDRSIRFDVHANATIKEVVDGGKPLINLYGYEPVQTVEEEKIAEAVKQTISAIPSPYDSHPSPADRFELVHALGVEGKGDTADAGGDVWDLFGDRAAMERWMTDQVRTNVAANYGVTIAAGDAPPG